MTPEPDDRAAGAHLAPGAETAGGDDATTPRRSTLHVPDLRRLLPALVAGLVAALLVGGALLVRPTTWSATQDVVVVPAKVSNPNDSAALFDTLSRGQVIATAAEMYGQPRWRPHGSTVQVTAGNVAPSAVVTVTAAGGDAGEVRRTLEQVVSTATPEISKVLAPYTVTALEQQASEPTAKGFSLPVKLVLALLAGLLTTLLVAALLTPLTRRRAAA